MVPQSQADPSMAAPDAFLCSGCALPSWCRRMLYCCHQKLRVAVPGAVLLQPPAERMPAPKLELRDLLVQRIEAEEDSVHELIVGCRTVVGHYCHSRLRALEGGCLLRRDVGDGPERRRLLTIRCMRILVLGHEREDLRAWWDVVRREVRQHVAALSHRGRVAVVGQRVAAPHVRAQAEKGGRTFQAAVERVVVYAMGAVEGRVDGA
eukprot:CAMPEP_0197912548 /NCGR_PEP_ID=MMETSP1439-20131203/74967_1 /TAXON_ID=66791 /ORGANISM="Gonyaulax spinifera, Strain CCMP409" /LENGTH=206 /DNA_ID=CAMNT_0043534343 /DNA_START=61 /DNA_END=677 /DNA_ORIENTATION=+